MRECTEGMNFDSNGNLYVPYDSEGKEFTMPNYYISNYGKVMSEINVKYDKCYKNKEFCTHISDRTYYFENHGYNEYNIYDVEED